MSDPSSQAKQARETLARALGALQGDPSVPPNLQNVAEPISQAMGALFQIERSGTFATAAAARDHVRTALGQLQADTSQHRAVATAMEAVAGSLGLVFGLVKLAEGAPTATAQPIHQQPVPAAAPAPAAYQAPQAAPAPAAYQPPPQAAPAPAAYQPPPQAAPAPAAYQPPPQAAPAPAAYQPPPQAAPAAAAAPPGGLQKFEASLGISSPSNFYKGLSGNDVVDHGGLFVSTYAKLPKVGTQIALKVILPGGYEFDTVAQIQWVRESGGDSTPGFGARFVQITPEHRQLVYRYVKNREPIFHDDF